MQGVEDQDLRKRIERLEDLLQLLLAFAGSGGGGGGPLPMAGDVTGFTNASILSMIASLAGSGNQLVGVDNTGAIQFGVVPGGSFLFTVINANDVDALVTTASTAVFFTGLTANHTATLPPAPATGQVVVVKDGDGSLAAHNIIINGNGKSIDGAATYTMTLAQDGLEGSISLVYNGASWGIV